MLKSKMDMKELRLRKMIKLSEVKSDESVLDLGCGKKLLKKYLPKVEYLGIDILNGADIKHNLEKGLPKQIKNKKFDVIFMGEFLEHIENFRSLLKECSKVLSRKGRIIISIPYAYRFQIKECKNHIHSFNENNIKNLARTCGLKLTRKIGTFVHIPILHLNIPSNQTKYTNIVIYRLERK